MKLNTSTGSLVLVGNMQLPQPQIRLINYFCLLCFIKNKMQNFLISWQPFDDFDITWHPIRGDLTVHAWRDSPVGLLSWQWDVFEMICDHQIHNWAKFHLGFIWHNIAPPKSVNIGYIFWLSLLKGFF